ncbi:MAG: hypothetical protein LBT05_04440 [Planctomycetaceae bacterium]|nr:hypothetical protein [Planctomycetaceae bacterium]
MSRPARRNVKNKRVSVPVKPLTLRLVIVKFLDKKTGDELSCWRLFTKVPGNDRESNAPAEESNS